MKKALAIIIALVCMMTLASAETDLSAMSIDELMDLRARIDAELSMRTASGDQIVLRPNEKVILAQTDDFIVYLPGTGSSQSFADRYDLDVVFENNSGEEAGLWARNIKLNGINMSASIIASKINSGEIVKDVLHIHYDDAMLTSADQIRQLSVDVYANTDSGEVDLCSVSIVFDPSFWEK